MTRLLFVFGNTEPTYEPTMHAHPPHPIDAHPAAVLAEAGMGSSCAVAAQGRAFVGLGGFGIGRNSGFGRQGWSRRDRYKQRGRTVAR
ncbi:MAG TPA: hypothetical protein VHG28_23090, partial [Longimicrobiaceae bacterium]|nr:hypothetical protein [Longimicrobiaceae bacterium]